MERGKAACRLSRTRRVTWRTEPLKVLAAELAKLPYRVLNIKDAVRRPADKPSRPTSNVLSGAELVNLHICVRLNDFYSVKIISYVKHWACFWRWYFLSRSKNSPAHCVNQRMFVLLITALNLSPLCLSIINPVPNLTTHLLKINFILSRHLCIKVLTGDFRSDSLIKCLHAILNCPMNVQFSAHNYIFDWTK